MERQSELYFTTGELARILRVRKHTLFHYDEIGLFSPALKEESGYRYHFVWQMDMFEVTRTLQGLGVSLGEIKEYVESRSLERFMSVMGGKRRQIGKEIRRLKSMKCLIPREEELMRLVIKTALGEPRLTERNREYLLVSSISAGSERKAAVKIAEHVRMQEKYHDTVGAVGSIYLGKDMDRDMYDRYVKVYTRLDKETASRRVQSRPKGVYVELYSRRHL